MTSRMGNKKNIAKGKGKNPWPCSIGRLMEKSKCTEADLQALVDEGLLQPREIVQWRPAE
jgi:hypothetical protein